SLTQKDVKGILALSEKMDAVVIGPGLGAGTATKTAVKNLLAHLKVPTVVDASALLYTNSLPKTCVLTPHRGEFKNLTGDDPTPKNAQKWAKTMHATIVVKGPEDIVADKDELSLNKAGNALMTVGGTGDALSGLIGGLMAQKMHPFDACKLAVKLMGQAGDHLAQKQGSLRAIDLVHAIPALLHKDK
ncbi:NAD(P)H-hydrate dehydratase, partial [Candidatus Peregrinibacteria bacterium]|nr:NAD(P)H-hydrate dehydratase [Candidatus Peregrinibacteria bacterium]